MLFSPLEYHWNNGRPVPNNPKMQEHKDIKNDTIFDGKGHYTIPYNTGDKHSVNRRWLEFHTIFYTQTGGYDAYYALGRKDNSASGIGEHNELTDPTKEREFKQELMGFDTSNQGDKSLPSMQVYLFPYRNWEQILQPNDYVAIRVKEQYPDDSHWDKEKDPYERHGIEERTLMTGLISDIRFTYSQQQGWTYSITCQGMQKILNDIYLGLPREAQISDVNLLFDINGESNPANEQFPFFTGGGSSPGGSVSSPGNAKEIGNAVEKGMIAWCNSKGLSINQTAGILASGRIESQFDTARNNHGNLLGASAGNVGISNPFKEGGSPHSASYAKEYMSKYVSQPVQRPIWSKYKSMRSSSAYSCGVWWGAHSERDTAHDNAQRGRIAESIASELK